jgi:mono/diheme cytochrome c family protein
MRRAWLLGVVAGVAVVAGAGGFFMIQRSPLHAYVIAADDPARNAAGETLYARHCASCHGSNLEGQPNWRQRLASGRLPAPPQDASGHSWHHPDRDLFGITKNGLGPYAPAGYESDMPAFGQSLNDDEIESILGFIKSRWPADIRARQQAINEQASP